MAGGPYQTCTIDGWKFHRVSGSYIDVSPPGAKFVAVDCINVYDYEKGEPTLPIPAERSLFRGVCARWLRDNADNLMNYREMAL